MTEHDASVHAARSLAFELSDQLQAAPTFRELDGATRSAALVALGNIRKALATPVLAQQMDVPAWRRPTLGDRTAPTPAEPAPAVPANGAPASTSPQGGPRSATAALAENTGRLADEIGFGAFVSGLVHSTFGAIVDASIKQMEEFADLVRSLARDVDEFTRDNITENQARDLLVERHPGDLQLTPNPDGAPGVRVAVRPTEDGSSRSPSWLADYGLAGRELDDDMAEQELVPAARKVAGEDRMQLLATMVLLGMNRVVVRDGHISAKVRIRAQAHDTTGVAVSQDPGNGSTWGTRGSDSQTMFVSTVGVNVQSDANLQGELFGEVQINFASETVPLERFAEPARMAVLQRNSRMGAAAIATPVQPPAAAATPPPAPPAQVPPAQVPPAQPRTEG